MTRLRDWRKNPLVQAALEKAEPKKAPVSERPAETQAHVLVIRDFSIPSKKNRYLIRFNQAFWKAIAGIVQHFKHPYWIDTAPDVKQAEDLIAYTARTKIKGTYQGPVRLAVGIRGAMDADNCLGVICDGLQRAGVIENDRQIKEVLVIHQGPGKGCEIGIEAM